MELGKKLKDVSLDFLARKVEDVTQSPILSTLRYGIRQGLKRSLAGNWPHEKGLGYNYVLHALRGFAFTPQQSSRLLRACLKTEAKLKVVIPDVDIDVSVDAGPPNLLLILDVIGRIEKHFPSSAKMLSKDFGIVNFDSIPPEWITDQIINMAEKDKPYILILRQANVGYDRAFRTIGREMGIMYSIREQALAMGHLVRVAEFTNTRDCLRVLSRMATLYGSPGKDLTLGNVSLLMLDSHGDTGLFATEINGNTKERRTLNSDQLENSKVVSRLGQALPKDCPIVIPACNSSDAPQDGKSIGEVIASKMGKVTFAAPAWPGGSSLKKITLRRGTDGNIKPEVTFDVREGSPLQSKDLPAVQFSPGS